MDIIYFLLFIFSPIIFLIGLISPSKVGKLIKTEVVTVCEWVDNGRGSNFNNEVNDYLNQGYVLYGNPVYAGTDRHRLDNHIE